MKITTVSFFATTLPNNLPTTWQELIAFCNKNNYSISKSDFEKLQNHAKSLLPNNIEQAAADLTQSNDEVIQQLLKNHLTQLGEAGDFNAYLALLNAPYLQKNDSDLLQTIFEKLYTLLVNKITTESESFIQAINNKSITNEVDKDNQYITEEMLSLMKNIEEIRTNPDLVSEIISFGRKEKKLHDFIITINAHHVYLQGMVLNDQYIFSQNDTRPPFFKTFFTLYCALAEYANHLIAFAKKEQSFVTKGLLNAASLKVNIPEEIKSYLLNETILPVINEMRGKINDAFKHAHSRRDHKNITHTIFLFENACRLLAQFPQLYQLVSSENKLGMFNNQLLALEDHIKNIEEQRQEANAAPQMDQSKTAEMINPIMPTEEMVQPITSFKLKTSKSPIAGHQAIFQLKGKEALASPDSPASKNAQIDNQSKDTAEAPEKPLPHPILNDQTIYEEVELVKRAVDLTQSFPPISFNFRKPTAMQAEQDLTQDITTPEAYCYLDEQLQTSIRNDEEPKLNKLAEELESIKEKLEMIRSSTTPLNIKATSHQNTIDYIDINQWVECQESIKELEVKINSAASEATAEKNKFTYLIYIEKALQNISEQITSCKELLDVTKSHCSAFDKRLSFDQINIKADIKHKKKMIQQARQEFTKKYTGMLDEYYSQRKQDYYHYDKIAKIGVFFARCIKPDYQTDKNERKAYIEKVKSALEKYAKNGNKDQLLAIINIQQFKSRTDNKNSPTYQLTLQYVINQLNKDLGVDIANNLEPDAHPKILPV